MYEALVQQGCDLVLAFPGFVEAEAEHLADSLGRPDDEGLHPDDIAAALTIVRNRFKADLGLSGADNRCHKPLKDNLEIRLCLHIFSLCSRIFVLLTTAAGPHVIKRSGPAWFPKKE